LNEPISLNEILHRDMHAICEYVRADAGNEIQKRLPVSVSGPNDSAWSMSDDFLGDMQRDGIFINDHYLPPGGTDEENAKVFAKRFQDRRTASVLSTVAHQMLPGILYNALWRVPGRQGMSQGPGAALPTSPTREGDVLMSVLWSDPGITGDGAPHDTRIDSLDGNRYRVSCRVSSISNNDGHVSPNGVERFWAEVSIDVNMGDDPPTVGNAQVDLIVRGREAVPGEALPPAAPQPPGSALRPPVPRIP
jgi:hypothetical protein